MFTGLIESIGRVSALDGDAADAGLRLTVQTGLARELAPGDSLAVNGVCLTVTQVRDGDVHADIGPETARVTTLGTLAPGRTVNLERAVRGDGRFGGHFVQGHVDGTGTITGIRSEGDAHWITVSFDPVLAPYLIRKGSIAVDGVSLTVTTLGAAAFDVMIIPFTWGYTSLGTAQVGERVNLECDMVGKYVARAAELAAKDAAVRNQSQ